jgi:hypothetical protein
MEGPFRAKGPFQFPYRSPEIENSDARPPRLYGSVAGELLPPPKVQSKAQCVIGNVRAHHVRKVALIRS